MTDRTPAQSMRQIMETIEEASRTDEVGRKRADLTTYSGVTEETTPEEMLALIDQHIEELRNADTSALISSYIGGDSHIMFDTEDNGWGGGEAQHAWRTGQVNARDEARGKTCSGRIANIFQAIAHVGQGGIVVSGSSAILSMLAIGAVGLGNMAMGGGFEVNLSEGWKAVLAWMLVCGLGGSYASMGVVLAAAAIEAVFSSFADGAVNRKVTPDDMREKATEVLDEMIGREIRNLEAHKRDPEQFKRRVLERVKQLRREGRIT